MNDELLCCPPSQGVHYGVFPGEFDAQGGLKSVWNVLRPHNWHPKSSEEHLLHLDATSGALLPQNLMTLFGGQAPQTCAVLVRLQQGRYRTRVCTIFASARSVLLDARNTRR